MKFSTLLFLILFFNIGFSQIVESFKITGSYTWVCPSNVTKIRIQCWGAGGGGGGSNDRQYIYGGQGGGGGSYSESTLEVTPGKSYFLYVGTGGNGGLGSTLGKDGEDTWFNIASNPTNNLFGVIAKGGKSGINASGPNTNNLNGGKSNNCIGQIKYNGGNGDKGSACCGADTPTFGVGGSSAGYENNGNDGNGRYGVAAPLGGGQGGGWSDGYYDGKAGSYPGGGGGGSMYHSLYRGGRGGDGQIIISYQYSKKIIVCDNYTDRDGKKYYTSGSYNLIINDTLFDLNLQINNKSYSTQFISTCSSYISPDGKKLTQSGTYTITTPNKVGCDSIITLNILIKNKSFSTLNPIICDSYKAPNGQILNNSGVYTIIIPNKAGCDSIITINLTVNKQTQHTINQIACDSYLGPNNMVYTKTGTYQILLKNKKGCDSIITLNLTINSLTFKLINDTTICEGNPITLNVKSSVISWDQGIQNNIPFYPTTTKQYTVIGTDDNGCKDTARVIINVLPNPKINILPLDSLICQNEKFTLKTNAENVKSYQWKLNGNIITNATSKSLVSLAAGDYSVSVKSNNGCEVISSPLKVQLSPLPNIEAGVDQTICKGSSVQLLASNASNYTWDYNIQNGVFVTPQKTTQFKVITTDSNGCTNQDSVLINVNNSSISEINTTSLGTFTLNNISYDKSGQYVQTLKNSIGCDSTITLNLVIEKLALDELQGEKLFIYPNPTNDGILYLSKDLEIEKVILMDYNSKKIQTYDSIGKINLSQYSKGIYFIEIKTSKGFIRVFKILFE